MSQPHGGGGSPAAPHVCLFRDRGPGRFGSAEMGTAICVSDIDIFVVLHHGVGAPVKFAAEFGNQLKKEMPQVVTAAKVPRGHTLKGKVPRRFPETQVDPK